MTAVLVEEDISLRLRGSTAPPSRFEARCPINLPDAGRALPPLDATDPTAEKTPAASPAKLQGYALALLTGRALPPAPPVPDGVTAPLAWHCHQPRLATVDGTGRVLIHSDPASGSSDPPAVLRHSLHSGARAVAWRPKAGATLAVAGSHGVCVWAHEPGAAASGASSTAGGRSVSSGLGKSPGLNRIGGAPEWRLTHLKDDADASRASRTDVDPYTSPAVTGLGRVVSTLGAMIPAPGPGGWGLPRELFETKSKHEGDFAGGRPYDCVCWSPCGRLLAAGSADRRATAVWEVSTGARCSIASGVAGVSGLAWSPCGRYLFASHPAGGFTLWETEGWTAAKWWTDGAAVIAAAWGPEPPPDDPNRHDGGDGAGATLLVTTRRGRGQVSAVHLPRRGPALAAQLLPVELPQFTGEDGAEVSLDIVGMSWDPSGSRLAVVLDGCDKNKDAPAGGAHRGGRVALYAMRTRPVVTASLIGYVEADAQGSDVGGAGGPARTVAMSGPGGGGEGEASATLAIGWEGGGVSVVPLYLR
jgi:aladin